MQRGSFVLAAVICAVLTPGAPLYGGQARVEPADYRIEPGKGIGKDSLGSTRSRVHTRLGQPTRSERSADGLREDTWRSASGAGQKVPQHAFTTLFTDDTAVQLEVSSPAFKTADGLSTATLFGELVKKLPKLWVSQFLMDDGDGTCVLYYDDVERGLAFSWSGHDEVLPGSKPEGVIVHARGSRVLQPSGSRPVRPPDLDKTGAPFPYTREETLRKSEAQILAMGRDRWVTLFIDGDRDTTTNAAEAESIFGHALERRNRARIARLPRPRQVFLLRLQGELEGFENHVIEMLASLSGGGDTYRSARAGVAADVGEVIGRLTGDRGEPVPGRHTGEIARRLDDLRRKLQALKSEPLKPTGEPFSAEYGLNHLNDARDGFKQLAELLRTSPRAESDLALSACLGWLNGKLAVH